MADLLDKLLAEKRPVDGRQVFRHANGGSIAERFELFHYANPHVYEELRRLALDLVARGHRKLGIGMLYEVVRWQAMLQTTSADGFRLNNNFRASYARMLMRREPRLEGVFETREIQA